MGKLMILLAFTALISLTGCSTNQAREHEGNLSSTSDREPYRPQYHLSPPTGWMGDPSGLVYHDGLYHFYYWRHAVSPDLVHWEHYPEAFSRIDSIGQMSGSVVVDRENTSGFGTAENPSFVAIYSMLRFSDGRQMQGIAYSTDGGRSYTHYEHNPVLDIGSTEFRDPQVFWYAPSERWVMTIALADERKVQFYSSPNLKDWTFLSDFGPAGAEGGVWECPDIFPLPVDGDTTNIKWLLQVDVQPVGGQYFIGSFDGERFVMDQSFENRLPTVAYMPSGQLLFDFEQGLTGWEMEGEAFAESPAKGALAMQSVIIGYKGEYLVNSFHQGDQTTGRLLSPEFRLEKDYINFLIGGGNHPGETAVNLVVDDKVVRTKTGMNTETMRWTNWEVKDLKGKNARIEIVDQHTGGFGHINVDHIMASDEPASYEQEKAFWIDYGPDFYAVRSWQDAPQNDTSRVWIAWMSNWLYAGDVPSEGFQGMQSLPRALALKTFPDGIRLVQTPVEKLKELRKNHFQVNKLAVEGINVLEGFMPSLNSYEIVVTFEAGASGHFGLHIAAGEEHKTVIGYQAEAQQVYVDRTRSGNTDFNAAFALRSEASLKPRDNTITLRIFVDQSSVEVFGNDGEVVISSLIFPEAGDVGIQLFSEEGSAMVRQLDAWELEAAL